MVDEAHIAYFFDLPTKVLEAMARDENAASQAVLAGPDGSGIGAEGGFGALPAVLIAIGCIVFALAVGSIIYLLCIRRRYCNHK